MIKYYCDICGNEALKHEYKLPLDPSIINVYTDGTWESHCFYELDEFATFKIHLCLHCALRIKNFIENQMIPNGKTYNEFLWDILHRERQ